MKRSLLTVLTATLLTGSAFAQTVVITPEQETEIRQYVSTQSVTPATVTGVEIEIGSTLPDTVELHRVDVPDVSYSYVVVDGRTVLVEPETRKIVQIVSE